MIDRFETFTSQIAKISKSIRKLKTVKSSKFNLTGPCVYCIYYLYKHNEGLTAKELCDYCDEDKGALSRTLDYLENNNYIACNSNAKKRYNSVLILTNKGNEVGKEFTKIIDGILLKMSNGVTNEERLNFYKTLNTICNNLQEISKNLGEDYD